MDRIGQRNPRFDLEGALVSHDLGPKRVIWVRLGLTRCFGSWPSPLWYARYGSAVRDPRCACQIGFSMIWVVRARMSRAIHPDHGNRGCQIWIWPRTWPPGPAAFLQLDRVSAETRANESPEREHHVSAETRAGESTEREHRDCAETADDGPAGLSS